MRALSAHDILGVWEVGQTQSPAQRALTLLVAACPERSREELAAFSIGARDALLLSLRESVFGRQFSGLATCPACGANLELAFDASEVHATLSGEPGTGTFSLSYENYDFVFRLPNSSDLLAIEGSSGIDAIKSKLLEECLLKRGFRGKEIAIADLPNSIVSRIGDEMGKHDPQADIRLALSCPSCDHHWETIFDIVSFAWTEISAWAVRLLREIHTLARAYGWREGDILAMSPARRRAYLELLAE
jgi:uncharacterized protein (UPF0212 family)